MKNLSSMRRSLAPVVVVVATVAVSFGVNALAATFTQPSGAPTNYNAPAPLDTSDNANAKVGGLILNTGGAANGLIVQAGNVGIGTTNPAASSLTVDNRGHTMQICLNGTDTTHCTTSIGSSGTNYWTLNGTQLSSNSGSNFQLGASPGGGTDQFDLFNTSGGSYLYAYSTGSSGASIGAYNPNGNSGKNLLLNPAGGNVGIGTTNPGYTLDVNGKVNASQYCVSGQCGWTGTYKAIYTIENQQGIYNPQTGLYDNIICTYAQTVTVSGGIITSVSAPYVLFSPSGESCSSNP